MWTLRYDTFETEHEGLREALCTLGNGYFATRGAAEEAVADDVHYPGTYLAGGFNRMKTEIAGRIIENEDLVNFPNWLPLTFRPEGGKWFHPRTSEMLSYRQELNLKEGVLERNIRCKDEEGRITTLRSRRIVHARRQHLAAIQQKILPENWSGKIQIRSALDGRMTNSGVERYKDLRGDHLTVLDMGSVGDEGVWLLVRTKQSYIRMAQAARTRVFRGAEKVDVDRELIEEHGYIGHYLFCDVEQGKELTIEKIVALYTSRDRAISESGIEAKTTIRYAEDFEDLLQSHTVTWEHYWHRCDILFDDDQKRTQLVMRLHIFHLLQTASVNTIDLDFGVPARGLHGEAYRGHIFWDELFIFPFLNFRIPEITRALLLYRYRRLHTARLAARKDNLKGALFPWQSGSNGREETQQLHLNPLSGEWSPDYTHLQRHVNAAIAYNIWQYFQTTGDMQFLCAYGAEMIIEIARLMESLTTYNKKLDRYEILRVVGPDEYHVRYPDRDEPGLDNNAYTNIMAVWVLCRALEVLEILDFECRKEIFENIHLKKEEIDRWKEISKKMRVVFHNDGIISQFEGYDKLEELDWDAYRKKHDNLQRLDRILKAENDTPNRYKISKQADVLMLFYLFSAEELKVIFERLGYDFKPEMIPKNIKYYLSRTDHGSTLSRIVHAWVLSRSDRVHAWNLFMEALESDISDIQGGTTKEGIHLGAMAGTVDLVQRCFTGLEIRDNIVWLNPALPDGLKDLRIRLWYRNNLLHLSINHKEVKITAGSAMDGGVKIGLNGKVHQIKPKESMKILL